MCTKTATVGREASELLASELEKTVVVESKLINGKGHKRVL
jgi:hypothetical protein